MISSPVASDENEAAGGQGRTYPSLKMRNIFSNRSLRLGTALFAALAGQGCANRVTPFRAPADVAQIRLERVDSPNVIIDQIWLERKDGPLAVCGNVVKRLRGDDTDQTRLEARILNSKGVVLQRVEGEFSPRHLVRHMGHPAVGTYHIDLGELPPGANRIIVSAQDAVH